MLLSVFAVFPSGVYAVTSGEEPIAQDENETSVTQIEENVVTTQLVENSDVMTFSVVSTPVTTNTVTTTVLPAYDVDMNETMDGTPDGALEDAEIYLVKIVAFVGCETGYVDTSALVQRNLPQRMVGLGTETAIGFKISIGCNSANIWTTTFYTSLLNGDNVLQAVIKACGRSNILLENVTICGNVYNTLK